jgi:hypothetical protein
MTAPRYSSAIVMSTRSIGSSNAIVDSLAASLRASAAAVWNATSDESTECALPSVSVTRTSTTGWPVSSPFSSWSRAPFSTDGMNCRGTAPPTTLLTNSKPEPRGSGSISIEHTADWPWPPDCLTCRPCTEHLRTNVAVTAC